MAEYYTQVSMEIEHLTDEEREWFQRKLDWKQLSDEEFFGYMAGNANDVDEKEFWPPFLATWEDSQTLWIRDDAGSIDTEALCCLLSDFLRDCRPEKSISIEWAYTCSKPRIGEFSGGCAFITHYGIESYSTYAWLTEQEKKFNAKIREVENAK